MEDLIRRIGQVKALMDNGMCRVGPRLNKSGRADALFTGNASRSVGLADAVVQLCRQDHPNEALPLLRHLADTVTAMAWVAAAPDPEARAGEVLGELAGPGGGEAWPAETLRERARQAGLPEGEVEDVLAAGREFPRTGRSALPWSHLFPENQHRGPDSGRVLGRAVRWMGRALKALDGRWPGIFPGGDEILA